MKYLSVHPDELYFLWQSEVQLENFISLGIEPNDIHILVGVKEGCVFNEQWSRLRDKYRVNIHSILDTRRNYKYPSSIRPHLIWKWLDAFPEFENEYIFYHDNDIILSRLPLFEGMLDRRWHVSKADYISWNYIDDKKSPSLMRDLLQCVGVPEELVKRKGQDVGGAQYVIPPGTSRDFWKKVELDCERMYSVYFRNSGTYIEEHFFNVIYDRMKKDNQNYTIDSWRANIDIVDKDGSTIKIQDKYGKWDFQIWTTDMWCIYWNVLLSGVPIVTDKELDFCWPMDPIERFEEVCIYHNSGISPESSDKWLHKQSYKTSTPFTDTSIKDKGFIIHEELGKLPACQRKYIEIIEKLSTTTTKVIDKLPLVSCLMTTYGRFTVVERSIGFFLDQDYPNKQLIIMNTAPVPLVLSEELKAKGIILINNNTDFETGKDYDNVGSIRRDITKMALGQYYICWDDDDVFLPWHISRGMKYILENNKRAYMPKRSYWSPNGGRTIEYASNAMEASCIVDINLIRKYGFNRSNGGEHLSWRISLRDNNELDENYDVSPWESYIYVWGEAVAPHKQSGTINNPNNFEEHKSKSTDFGNRELGIPYKSLTGYWYNRIMEFNKSVEVSKELGKYVG